MANKGAVPRLLPLDHKLIHDRSTYYLQLPFTYGIPLLVTSATLHWLVSEALFLVLVSGDNDSGEESAVGYSIAPIIAIIVLTTCMLATAVGMGFKKLASATPVAGSCSVAIAAACHRPKDDKDASVLPLMWGEVEVSNSDEEQREVGHCCFTSMKVTEPTVGRLYAGVEALGRRFSTIRCSTDDV